MEAVFQGNDAMSCDFNVVVFSFLFENKTIIAMPNNIYYEPVQSLL